MAPSGDGVLVVRRWTNPRAPTGEGTYYETEDGTVWRSTIGLAPLATGDERGELLDGRVYR